MLNGQKKLDSYNINLNGQTNIKKIGLKAISKSILRSNMKIINDKEMN